MQGKLPLAIAVISGVLAISIVAVDLRFGVDAHLQERQGESWVPLSSNGEARPFFGCAGPELRLHVENNRLLDADVPVSIGYWTPTGGHTSVLSDTWHMQRGEVRQFAFTVPAEAFQGQEGKATVSVDVQVGEVYLGTCVEGT